MKLADFLNGHAKGIFSGLVAGVLMYLSLKTDGMTSTDWSTTVITALAAGGAAWAIPNTGPQAPQNKNVPPA